MFCIRAVIKLPVMKTKQLLSLLSLGLFLNHAHSIDLIAFWDFNDGFDFDNDSVQIVHAASIGSGTLFQQRADTDGNGKGGNAYSQSGFSGATSSINASDGKSMAWDDVSKSGDNDAEFFLTFSTAGFTDIEISFDIKGNTVDGIVSYDVKYDFNALIDVTDPGDVTGTIKDFSGGNSTSLLNNHTVPTGINTAAFERTTLDFLAAIDNQNTVTVRFDDFKENDALSIDNLLITGTAVPEPGHIGAVAGALALAWVARRRRNHA